MTILAKLTRYRSVTRLAWRAEMIYDRFANRFIIAHKWHAVKASDFIGVDPEVEGKITHRADLDEYWLTVIT